MIRDNNFVTGNLASPTRQYDHDLPVELAGRQESRATLSLRDHENTQF